jgi:hypothetical protein
MNSGTAPTTQVPIVQPFYVIETPTDGVGAHAAPPSDNLDKIMGLHKLSVETKAVHMELM